MIIKRTLLHRKDKYHNFFSFFLRNTIYRPYSPAAGSSHSCDEYRRALEGVKGKSMLQGKLALCGTKRVRLILYGKSPTIAPAPVSLCCDTGSGAPLGWDRVFPLLHHLNQPCAGIGKLVGEIKGGFLSIKGPRMKGWMGNGGPSAYMMGRAELNLSNFLLRFFWLKFPAAPSTIVCVYDYKKYPLCYFFKLKQFPVQCTSQCRCLVRNVQGDSDRSHQIKFCGFLHLEYYMLLVSIRKHTNSLLLFTFKPVINVYSQVYWTFSYKRCKQNNGAHQCMFQRWLTPASN